MRSAGFRYLIVGLLTLLMVVPLFLAGAVIEDRKRYADQTLRDVGREWGGEQVLTGPVLVVPVIGDVTRQERRETTDAAGQVQVETVTLRERGAVTPVTLLPETLVFDAVTRTDIRRRGIFEVPVYGADVTIDAAFDPARIAGALGDGDVAQWDRAVLRLGLGSNAGLRGEAVIEGPDGPLPLEPFAAPGSAGIAAEIGAFPDRRSGDFGAVPRPDGAGGAGIEARVTAPRAPLAITARFSLNGAQRLYVSPVGRDSRVTMSGDWPDPGFSGAFLPDGYEITDAGYSAAWTIPHLARTLPQVSRAEFASPGAFAFGTEFVRVNDFYQKAFRAARYGILFIALTFLTVLLIDRKDRPTHPVQYILIGLAQSIFVLLMVAYAEQIGFTPAYLGASVATIALLTLFGATALRMGRRTLVLTAMLVVLYAVLYLILRSTDLALLAGATLAFGALALTMILTRNESWYGASGPGQGMPRTRRVPVPGPPTPETPAPPEQPKL